MVQARNPSRVHSQPSVKIIDTSSLLSKTVLNFAPNPTCAHVVLSHHFCHS